MGVTINKTDGGSIKITINDKPKTYAGTGNVTVVEDPTDFITIVGGRADFNINFDISELEELDGGAPTGTTQDKVDKIADMFQEAAGGSGGGSVFLDPLFFSGTGTEEDPIVPLGWRDTEGNAKTTDGSDNIIPLLSNPVAPTGGVVDDDANTFGSVVKNPGFPNVEDYEGFIDIGGTPVEKEVLEDVDGNLYIIAGNIDAAIGTVGIRVKAVADIRNASPFVLNDEPFVASWQDLNSFTLKESTFNNTSNDVFHTGSPYAVGVADWKFAEGAVGRVEMLVDSSDCKSVLGVETGYDISISPSTAESAINYNVGQTRIFAKFSGVDYASEPGFNPGATFKIGLEITETQIKAQYSNDDGATWTTIEGAFGAGTAQRARPAGELFIKVFCEEVPTEGHNLRALGVVAI